MRSFLTAALCMIVLCLAASSARAQAGYDRPGGDYSSFQVRGGDPAVCAARCERDSRCRAWTFSYPLTAAANPVCWLKDEVRPRVAGPCCISGVRGAAVNEPRADGMEYAIDRLGGDFREAPMGAEGNAQTCRAACEAEGRCRAWTYARPGYLGSSARCFLKSEIKPPRRKPCCISGVVR
jgi:hypothetical protein